MPHFQVEYPYTMEECTLAYMYMYVGSSFITQDTNRGYLRKKKQISQKKVGESAQSQSYNYSRPGPESLLSPPGFVQLAGVNTVNMKKEKEKKKIIVFAPEGTHDGHKHPVNPSGRCSA